MTFTDEQREQQAEDYRNARALELAKAHHAAMGPAMREHNPKMIVAGWLAMPQATREVMVAVMRKLLDDGTIA